MRSPRAWIALLLLVGLAWGCGPLRRFGYAGFGRDAWQQPEQVVASLGIAPGMHVADLGAGGGYFTWRLADAVGESGRLYAVDVDPDMTGFLERRARQDGRANVEVILAPYDDPRIPEPGVDLLFTCNTYHHLEARSDYFHNAARYLRPGARVAVIEYKRHGWLQRWFGHFTEAEAIRSEMQAAGYRLVESFDYLERQSFQVFELAGG